MFPSRQILATLSAKDTISIPHSLIDKTFGWKTFSILRFQLIKKKEKKRRLRWIFQQKKKSRFYCRDSVRRSVMDEHCVSACVRVIVFSELWFSLNFSYLCSRHEFVTSFIDYVTRIKRYLGVQNQAERLSLHDSWFNRSRLNFRSKISVGANEVCAILSGHLLPLRRSKR